MSLNLFPILAAVCCGLGTATASLAVEAPFHAEATGAHAGKEKNSLVLDLAGRGSRLGEFRGTLLVAGGRFKKQGAMSLEGAGGAGLYLDFEVSDPDRDGVFDGTFAVTGGTGELAGAAGMGSMTVLPGEPLFLTLDGTISLD